MKGVEDKLLVQTAWSFRRNENIKQAINWFKEHPEDLSKRLDQLNIGVRLINSAFTNIQERRHSRDFRDVIKLHQELNGSPLPSLSTLAELSKNTVLGKRTLGIIGNIQDTFNEIKSFEGRWAWVNQETDPKIIASGLLVEGYGLAIAKHFSENQNDIDPEELARTFVLAFEGIIYLYHKSDDKKPELLEDILPWMIEEKTDFPPEIALLLEQEEVGTN